MKTCPECKVEFAETRAYCPLCGANLDREPKDGTPSPNPQENFLLDPGNKAHLSSRERLLVAGEVLSVSAVIAALSVLLVDVITDARFTWSFYPLASIAFVWCCAALPLFLYRKPFLLMLLLSISLPAFLAAIDLADGHFTWFLPLALPIALCVEISSGAAMAAIKFSRRKGLNTIAYVIISITVICVSLEMILDRFLSGQITFGWSDIVAYTLIPIAVFLLYLHHRIVRSASLRKLFRI